jgi:hypothetical protein
MKRLLLVSILLLTAGYAFAAQDFDKYFTGRTLRLDYTLAGSGSRQDVYLGKICRTGEWAGRRSNLDSLLVEGNAQVAVRSPEGSLLYVQSFSTLFQEWLTTEEATRIAKSFECPVLIPEPRQKVRVELSLINNRRSKCASLEFELDPTDILIREFADNGDPRQVLMEHGPLEGAYDIVIVAEGYTAAQQQKFFEDALRLNKRLFSHAPFSSLKSRFNVRAVFAPSAQSGTSQPSKGDWKRTAASSHFDTFYSDRYLTSSSLVAVHDAIGTVPFEQIILLVNTERYGGGGIFNNITLCTADHPFSPVVFVHEFGHSFAGLADEYDYGDEEDPTYPPGIEPWEPNITTLVDFASKWQDMLPQGIQIPTPVDDLDKQDVRRIWNTFTPEQKGLLNLKVGVYEGAGYQLHGVYRPVQECRMRINECEEFCPVCYRAIVRMIDYYTR